MQVPNGKIINSGKLLLEVENSFSKIMKSMKYLLIACLAEYTFEFDADVSFADAVVLLNVFGAVAGLLQFTRHLLF